MSKIRLAILNSSPFMYSYGGIGPFIKNLDPFLNNDFDVSYITLPPRLHNIKFLPRRVVYLLYTVSRIRKIKKFDIVLSHVPEGSYIISLTNTPFIHIFHGNFNPMSGSRFWYGKYFKFIFDLFERRILKKAKVTFTVGNERPNVSKILNPIYHKSVIKPYRERAGFIFAGRLEKIKNINKIIEVYSQLPQEIKNNHPLYIAGSGTQELFLRKLSVSLNLKENIIFTGEIFNTDLIEFVSYRKILLMASSIEGLPMAIAESLSVGVPVVTTNPGDISRVIKDNYNGFLLPVEFDPNRYADRIQQILRNYEIFAKNALLSSEIFKAKNVAEGLIETLKLVANKNKKD